MVEITTAIFALCESFLFPQEVSAENNILKAAAKNAI
jgi:hypothetical protein